MDLFFLWICSLVIGYWVFKKIRDWQNLPPGPWGLPVVGYLPYLDPKQPHLTLTALSKAFGPIYGIRLGSVYTVVLSDPKVIREAFSKETFSGRAPLFLTHGIMHGNGIICAEGSLWKDQRKLITSWLKSFGMSKFGQSRDKLEKRIAEGVNDFLENVNLHHQGTLDLSHMVTETLGNIINDIIFGFKFPSEDKTWQWFRQIQEEGTHEMGVAGVVNFLPFIRFFSSGVKKTMDVLLRGQAQTHRLYASIINRRRKMLDLETPKGAEFAPHHNLFNEHPFGHIKCIKYSKYASTTEEHYFDPETLIPNKNECILDKFLEEQKKRFEEGDENSKFMTDEQMHYLLADMFGAGLDTSSVTLSWLLLFLALYPQEQKLIRDELMEVYPEEGEIDGNRLPRLMANICETQRLRSIVPIGIPHGCLQDTYLGNYKIPKGTMVVPLQWAIHMNADYWEDPEEYKPDRFLDADRSLLKPQEFIPFQTGKRMCPGDELSRMLTCGLVARLIRRWNLSLAGQHPSKSAMMGKVGLTLSPPHVLYICERI